MPNLLPQVYLHYDLLTLKQRVGRLSALTCERMDSLLLVLRRTFVVFEFEVNKSMVNNMTSMATRPSRQTYGQMAVQNRRLRSRGLKDIVSEAPS